MLDDPGRRHEGNGMSSARDDLILLGEALYAVSHDKYKEHLCRCAVPWQHKPDCIWWASTKFLKQVQREIARLELED